MDDATRDEGMKGRRVKVNLGSQTVYVTVCSFTSRAAAAGIKYSEEEKKTSINGSSSSIPPERRAARSSLCWKLPVISSV